MNLTEIEARAAAAIPLIAERDPYITGGGGIVLLYGPYPMANAEIITAFYRWARLDIPGLLVLVRQLQAALDARSRPAGEVNPVNYEKACEYAREVLGSERFWPAGTYSTIVDIHAKMIMKAATEAYEAGLRAGGQVEAQPEGSDLNA